MSLPKQPSKLYYAISEVAELAGVPAHVLRYWEKEFPTLKPKKNSGGNRVYRPADVEMVLRIKKLLYEEGLKIAGARKRLNRQHAGLEEKRGVPSRETVDEVVKGLEEVLTFLD
jgi:DNA-binding transcriptional MerR regulator